MSIRWMLLGVLVHGSAIAQTPEAVFPSKLVRLVIPFAVGGSGDASARIIAPPLTERWKQQVIIDPRPGAATVLGTDIVAKSHGTSNPYNMVRATLDALKNSTTASEVAAKRGKSVEDIFA